MEDRLRGPYMNLKMETVEKSLSALKRWFAGSVLIFANCAVATAFAADGPRVVFKTTMGTFTVEVNSEKAPRSAENFLKYVNDRHYDGTVFHRVIKNFMVQGGGFDKEMQQKPTRDPIPNEAKNGLRNAPYTIAMARTGDPQSATAQFFINTSNNRFLDYPGQDGWGYAVFGKVVAGQDVIDKMNDATTRDNGMHQNVPSKPIVIESASIVK